MFDPKFGHKTEVQSQVQSLFCRYACARVVVQPSTGFTTDLDPDKLIHALVAPYLKTLSTQLHGPAYGTTHGDGRTDIGVEITCVDSAAAAALRILKC